MKVILRRNESGQLVVYLPKKDLEEAVVAVAPGEDGDAVRILTLANGWRLSVALGAGEPPLPLTVKARRVDGVAGDGAGGSGG